ncbi:hypothetical protein DERF_000544 [Dermatophagoides farinae]|uniref:Uncharacterized protein n=1 Tax=Dermatophagoides farinae TaxID=6954 RepID=A0A922IAE1_DERFA|nr:hypothetical protein DERF_000544 [Dermatophagoides farinae]
MEELNISEKIELYKLLVANGFESIDEERLAQSPLADYGVEKIEKILNNYRKSTDSAGCLGDSISNLLNLKQHYKCEFFNTTFADIMMMKAKSFDDNDNEYAHVYRFIAQLLRGQLADLSELNEKSMNIMLTLIREMQLLVNSFDSNRLLVSESDEQQQQENVKEKQTLETLKSMFKFQRISEFMNPLNISAETNDRLLQLLLDAEDKRRESTKKT